MKKGLIIGLGILGFLAFMIFTLASWVMGSYNNMVTLNQGVEKVWGDVETAYQRRSDMIPNLMQTTKGYAEHEKGTFTAVTEARAKVGQIKLSANDLTPENLAKFNAAQGELSSALSKLMMIKEAYPELKADKLFVRLMDEVAGTENRINVARQRYNETAQEYNVTIKRFPGMLIAGFFNFKEKPYFKSEAGSEKAPKIDFSTPSGK
jgi:LemA protein